MLTLHFRVLGSIPSDAANAATNYGHENTALLGVFPFAFTIALFFPPSW
jgi:hypothetical protein